MLALPLPRCHLLKMPSKYVTRLLAAKKSGGLNHSYPCRIASRFRLSDLQRMQVTALKKVSVVARRTQRHQMRGTAYIYPVVGNRTSPKEWVEQGSTNSVHRAKAKKHDILSTHYPEHISEEIDAQIRGEFPIKLLGENMSAANKHY